jgi:hypothetical protein
MLAMVSRFFSNFSFTGATASQVVFGGGASLGTVTFTADNQALTFGATSTVSGTSSFAGFAGKVTVDSTAGDNTFTAALTSSANTTAGTLAITGGAK